jgi:D-serine deaminase-like pyridoxal phosphate-dependent protein
MAALLAPTGAKLRAHAKTHKSSVIAKLQMARGAVGQCVQKVAEAEALAWGGIPDILVTNQVVGPRKLARLAALARIAEVAVCVDDAAQIALIEAAAEAAGVRLPVLVEIDVGMARGGVEHGPPAVALAERIAASRHLRFGGLQAYHGSAQHKRGPEERAAAIEEAVARSRRTVEQLRQRGLECPIVGGAGTGTGSVLVDDNGTLGGRGFITGAVIVDGILKPGASAGTRSCTGTAPSSTSSKPAPLPSASTLFTSSSPAPSWDMSFPCRSSRGPG